MKCRALVAVAAFWLVGCMGPREIQATRVYTLDPTLEVRQFAPVERTVGVRPIMAARPYEVVMSWLDENNRLHFLENDTWAETPGDYLTRAIIDALNATGHFSDVGDAANLSRPDLILTGELRKFYENRAMTPPAAEVEVRLELREARATRNLWGDIVQVRVPLQGTDAQAFATAMNVAVAQAAQQAAEAIAAATP